MSEEAPGVGLANPVTTSRHEPQRTGKAGAAPTNSSAKWQMFRWSLPATIVA